MATSEFQVSGMTCGHCEGAITQEVTGIPGVTEVEVSAATGRLVVNTNTDNPADTGAVLAAVEEAGYEAVPA